MAEKTFNMCSIIGDVVAVQDGLLLLKEIQTTPSGIYENDHLILVGNADVPKGAAQVEVTGHLAMPDRDVVVVADSIRAADGEAHESVAHLIGYAARTVQYQPPIDGKPGFANIRLQIGEEYFGGVAFRGTAMVLGKKATKGSLVQLYGRIQRREFVDKNDEERVTVEIMADDDLTKVLESAVIQSKFAAAMPQGGGDVQKQAMMALIKKPSGKKSQGRKAVTKSTTVPDAI